MCGCVGECWVLLWCLFAPRDILHVVLLIVLLFLWFYFLVCGFFLTRVNQNCRRHVGFPLQLDFSRLFQCSSNFILPPMFATTRTGQFLHCTTPSRCIWRLNRTVCFPEIRIFSGNAQKRKAV